MNSSPIKIRLPNKNDALLVFVYLTLALSVSPQADSHQVNESQEFLSCPEILKGIAILNQSLDARRGVSEELSQREQDIVDKFISLSSQERLELLKSLGDQITKEILSINQTEEIGFHFNRSGAQKDDFLKGGLVGGQSSDGKADVRWLWHFSSRQYSLFEILMYDYNRGAGQGIQGSIGLLIIFDLKSQHIVNGEENGRVRRPKGQNGWVIEYDSNYTDVYQGQPTFVSPDTFIGEIIRVDTLVAQGGRWENLEPSEDRLLEFLRVARSTGVNLENLDLSL